MKRQVMIATVAAAAMLAPVLSTTASATCWFDCSPNFPVPIGPSPLSTDDTDWTANASFDECAPDYAEAGDADAAAVPVPWPEPEKCWTCCSPPGGPVCCSSPDGKKTICYGEPIGPGPIEAAVSSSTESCLASVPQDYSQEELLECRDDDIEPQTASILVRLLQMFA